MTKALYLNIIIVFLLSSCTKQNERIESKLMECFYQSYADNGIQFKQLISDHQKLLIDEGILLDNSGKSYKALLRRIAENNKFDKVPSKFFLTQFHKIEKLDVIDPQECQKTVMADSALYNISKLKNIDQAIIDAQGAKNIQPSLIAKEFIEVLTEEDFELNFYKLRAFFLFEMIDTESGISRKLPNIENKKDYDLSNAFRIYIDAQSKIYIKKKKIALKQIKPLAIKYYQEKTSKAVIDIKTEGKTKHSTYVAVQNEINSAINTLRNTLSIKKYGKDYYDLDQSKKDEMNKKYPKSIATE